jgi:hypothetical protein
MACVGEGDARALSVGRRWCGSDDPFRIAVMILSVLMTMG